jgi:hypothetical protein
MQISWTNRPWESPVPHTIRLASSTLSQPSLCHIFSLRPSPSTSLNMSTTISVSDSTSFTTANPPPLKEDNWHAWEPLIIAYLRSGGEYRLVAGQLARLSPPQLLVEGTTTAGVAIPFTLDQQMFNARLTNTFNKSVEKYDVLQEKACGDMMKFLSPSQRVHVKGKEGDGPGMWAALVAIHLQQEPGTRFSAHNELFSIVKSPASPSPTSQLVSQTPWATSRSCVPRASTSRSSTRRSS